MSSCYAKGCKDVRGKACHCVLCHQSFASLRLFDDHQQVTYNTVTPVTCVGPETLGLVLDAWGTWRTPENLITTTNRISAMNTSRYEKRQGE